MLVFEHHWIVGWDQEVQVNQEEGRGRGKSDDNVVETEWNRLVNFQFQLNSRDAGSDQPKQLSSFSQREWRYSKITQSSSRFTYSAIEHKED